MEANPAASFSSLPKEIKQIIFSYFTDVREVIRIQPTCKEFRAYMWLSITSLDFKHVVDSQHGDHSSRPEEGLKYFLQLIRRLNPSIVTELHLSGFYLKSVLTKDHASLLQNFTNVRKLSFDYNPTETIHTDDISLYMTKLTDIIATGVKITWWDSQHNFFNKIPSHVRIRNIVSAYPEVLYQPNYNTYTTDYVVISKQEMHRFPNATQAVSGLSYADKLVIGNEDGSICIFKYDNEANRLVEVATNNTLHSGRINEITQADNKIVISSSDGKVSLSDLNDTGLVPVDVMTFPEPIYFCQYINDDKQTYIAAGKSTLYVSTDGDIVKQQAYDSDVTGVSYVLGKGYAISTRDAYYYSPVTAMLEPEEIDQLVVDWKETPNMCLSPDGSLRATARQTEFELYDFAKNESLYSIPGTFEEAPHLQAYCPVDYWLTFSTGHSMITFNLENQECIMYISPEISDDDLRKGNFPTIRALWYEKGAAALFALLSDNTLRWWKFTLGPESSVKKAEAYRLAQATPDLDPNAESVHTDDNWD